MLSNSGTFHHPHSQGKNPVAFSSHTGLPQHDSFIHAFTRSFNKHCGALSKFQEKDNLILHFAAEAPTAQDAKHYLGEPSFFQDDSEICRHEAVQLEVREGCEGGIVTDRRYAEGLHILQEDLFCCLGSF